MSSPSSQPEVRRHLDLLGVRTPKPLMPPETERQLTPRQRQVLDSLETLVVDEELADMTMAQIAAQVNCSLRTLYGISPSKEELVMTVMDRRLHRIGRAYRTDPGTRQVGNGALQISARDRIRH